MIMQWNRTQEGYAAHWSKIDFLLAQDPTTKLWSVRANGKKCTTYGKLKTWKSAQAAMDDMDERQTAILLARRLFHRPAVLTASYGAAKSQMTQGEATRRAAAKGKPALIPGAIRDDRLQSPQPRRGGFTQVKVAADELRPRRVKSEDLHIGGRADQPYDLRRVDRPRHAKHSLQPAVVEQAHNA